MPKKTKAAAAAHDRALAEAVDLLMQVPEIQEALSPAELILAQDDVGYVTNNGIMAYITPAKRNRLIGTSRAYWNIDPLAKQAVRIWTDYAVGTGITFDADDEGNQGELNKFWKNRRNKRLTCSAGQQKLSRKLLVDGDIFFAIFGGEGQPKVIRTIDPIQVTTVLSAPDDDEEIVGYKREIPSSNSTTPKTLYYRDWASEDSDAQDYVDPDTKKAVTWEENVIVYHVAFESLDKRGTGLLFTVCSWSKEHRRFMEARVSLTQALAKFAFKLTAKGNDKVLGALQSQLQSTVPSNGGLERNPAKSNAATFLQNQGLDLQAMPRSTGGGEARSDGDQLKLMVSAGTNVMLHYFGDPSTGNLATAEAMELPMLKSFTSYQELWKDTWRDIFSIVLEENIDEDPADISVKLPAMLKDDLSRLGQFLMGLHQVFPEIQVPEILQMCLVACGVNNVEEVMESIEEKREELAKLGLTPLGNQLPPIGPNGKPGTKALPARQTESYTQAIEKLAEAISKL